MNLRSFFSPEVSINCHWKITLSMSVSGRKLEWTNPHRANIAKIKKRYDQRNESLFFTFHRLFLHVFQLFVFRVSEKLLGEDPPLQSRAGGPTPLPRLAASHRLRPRRRRVAIPRARIPQRRRSSSGRQVRNKKKLFSSFSFKIMSLSQSAMPVH